MKAFLRRVLGVDMLSVEVRFLSKKVRELSADKDRLELEVSSLKAKSLNLSTTQACKLHAIVRQARKQASAVEVA